MDFKHKFEVETGQGIYSGEGQIEVNGTYNDAYVDWLEQQLHLARVVLPKGTLCEHTGDEVLHQGNGFVYKTCADCGEDI